MKLIKVDPTDGHIYSNELTPDDIFTGTTPVAFADGDVAVWNDTAKKFVPTGIGLGGRMQQVSTSAPVSNGTATWVDVVSVVAPPTAGGSNQYSIEIFAGIVNTNLIVNGQTEMRVISDIALGFLHWTYRPTANAGSPTSEYLQADGAALAGICTFGGGFTGMGAPAMRTHIVGKMITASSTAGYVTLQIRSAAAVNFSLVQQGAWIRLVEFDT